MKRYVLFFVFIGIQANVLAYDNDEMKKQIRLQFENRFHDLIVDKNNVDEQVIQNITALEAVCSESLRQYLDGLESRDEKFRMAGEECVAHFARIKAQYKYRKNTSKQEYNEAVEKQKGQKALHKVFEKFNQGNSGSLAYLINDGPIERKIFTSFLRFLSEKNNNSLPKLYKLPKEIENRNIVW